MWTSDELTPRSRTFIPDRGARTFNLARLSHMKRTTDTRCGSRPLTQVYTLTLSHSLTNTLSCSYNPLSHSSHLSLSLVHTFMPHTTLSLSFIYSHNNTTRDFEIVHSNLLLTHSLTQRRFTLRYTQNANARWSDLGRSSTHPPLPSSALSISLSLTHKHPSDTFCLFHFHCESRIREIFFEST